MTEERRTRTRTLIQLGGLVERSGLMEELAIQVGQDLQKDEELFNSVAILTAILSQNVNTISALSFDEKATLIEVGRGILKRNNEIAGT